MPSSPVWFGRVCFGPALLGCLAVGLGCGGEAPVEPRAIHAHYPRSCPPGSDSSGSRTIELRALGDFDPTNATVAFVGEEDRDRVLSIPDQTRAVELRTVGPGPYWGLASIASDTATDVALWPVQQPCRLLRGENTTSSPAQGATLGRQGNWLLAIGVEDGEGQPRAARLIDLGTGAEVTLDSARMTRARSFATLTPVGQGLLAAGGEDLERGVVHDDAEYFDPTLRRFQGSASVIALRRARTRHAALALDDASIALIGGADGNGQPLRDLERVSLQGTEADALAQLGAARIEPAALRLSDGRIVVAGGYAIDAQSQPLPIGIVEWFNAEATRQESTLNLEDAALGRAFVATPFGGLLAAGGCDVAGVPSAAVWWIDAEGEATRMTDLPTAAQSCRPQLGFASLSAPFLFSNGQLWRFDPWQGAFVRSEIDLGESAEAPLPVISADPGLLLWLDVADSQTSLFALRHDTRNTYSADVTPFLISDSTRLAPNRAASATSYARYDDDQTLELVGEGEVWITDTEYLDFNLELTTAAQQAQPPLVLIGSREVGGTSCRWPPAREDGVFQLQRRGTQLTLTAASQRNCTLPTASSARIGFRANGEPTRIQRIVITRGSPLFE